MCNNSIYIRSHAGDQVVNKKQLMGKHQKWQPTHVKVKDTGDLFVLTKNRFEIVTVEPCIDEVCQTIDSGHQVSEIHKFGNKTQDVNSTTTKATSNCIAKRLDNAQCPRVYEFNLKVRSRSS